MNGRITDAHGKGASQAAATELFAIAGDEDDRAVRA
jgi:hypothetical protein